MSESETKDKIILDDLEDILQNNGNLIILEDLDFSPGCPPEENFVADVIRIVASGKRQCLGIWTDFRKNFIIKRIPERTSLKYKFYDCRRLFENEINVYEVFVPLCRRYLQKKSLNRFDGLCLPKYYGQCQSFLVLEDLQTKGYQMVNRIRGFSKKECTLILQTLSKFHAVSFALKKNEASSFSKVTNLLKETLLREECETDVLGAIWENSLKMAVRSLSESKDVRLLKVSKNLKFYSGKVLRTLSDLIKPSSNKFSVICHGDLWNNNILLQYCEFGFPIAVKFIDLQATRYSSCVLDVMHVLFTSSKPSVYDEHFYELLMDYYESLTIDLKNLGESIGFTFDEFKAEFKSKILFGIFFACLMYISITRSTASSARNLDLSGETFSDPNQMESMYQSLSPDYHERLRSLFVVLENLDLI